jgi:acetyl/propionyl-CoA carboxylase alpha subunit
MMEYHNPATLWVGESRKLVEISSLLVANRGEIAVRICRAAQELGIRTVAVQTPDDAAALHVHLADEVHVLDTEGPAGYLDVAGIVAAATATGCDAVHPGYGFLSESPALAEQCEAAGVTFVGPTPETLRTFGDKGAARTLAEAKGVPVLAGTRAPTELEAARGFMDSLGSGAAVMIKAAAGGGGRGMRRVTDPADLEAAHERCRSEAERYFGSGDVYLEEFLPDARHIEVQVVADRTGAVRHLWERECSIQRQHQKLVELAPAPGLAEEQRQKLLAAAVRLAQGAGLRSLATVEFLVSVDGSRFAFIETNPRLQVEHTVTEEVTGVDLVQTQIRLAGGATLVEVGLDPDEEVPTRGIAVQLRVNAEQLTADGEARPSAGPLTAFAPPSGPGIRVDSAGYAGGAVNPRFDSLLAKVIVHSQDGSLHTVADRAYRALGEFRVDGPSTNLGLLQSIVAHPAFREGRFSTDFLERHADELLDPDAVSHRTFYADVPVAAAPGGSKGSTARPAPTSDDPLAVLDFGQAHDAQAVVEDLAEGELVLVAPTYGTVVQIRVQPGDEVVRGATVAVLEAMKMEHVVEAEAGGRVREVRAGVGETLDPGSPLIVLEATQGADDEDVEVEEIDLDEIRADLEESIEAHERVRDEARPEAVERRRRKGQQTARENVAAVVDEGTFVEYGALTLAAQRQRRSVDELMQVSPADGLVAGVGTVNGDVFGHDRTRAAVLAYDYTVFAGTQGHQNHRKKDRLFQIAGEWGLPVVLFSEGGGGRPGETDGLGVAELDSMAFSYLARLSGSVPLVGVNAGRCFAGNAALLACCDVIIATKDSNIGMGGPAMIEGGGLGVFRPEDVGPISVQRRNGVVDVVVEDEVEGAAVAKRYLSYFQGDLPPEQAEHDDQRHLRHLIPENRVRVYDVRRVIDGLVDTGSVLELRRDFGVGIVTSLARIDGRSVGIVANDPTHLGGAIDADGADKASRFMQLCNAFRIPIVSLCDTPGFMVGPQAEETATVRHFGRMFVTAANISVPIFTIILRKAYGLGAQAMCGGSFKTTMFTVSWPTGEMGAMGLEGAVKLGYRKELAAIEDPEERKEVFERMVAEMYERGKALNVATHFEFDDVIDPAATRSWLLSGLESTAEALRDAPPTRNFVDTW